MSMFNLFILCKNTKSSHSLYGCFSKVEFWWACSDWVTGKRGRRNSVGSLDSTIEVSLAGAGLRACCMTRLHVWVLTTDVSMSFLLLAVCFFLTQILMVNIFCWKMFTELLPNNWHSRLQHTAAQKHTAVLWIRFDNLSASKYQPNTPQKQNMGKVVVNTWGHLSPAGLASLDCSFRWCSNGSHLTPCTN